MLQAKVVLPGEDPSSWPFPTPLANSCWVSLDLSSLGLTFKPQWLAEGGKALAQDILEHPSEAYICTLQPLWRGFISILLLIFIIYTYFITFYFLLWGNDSPPVSLWNSGLFPSYSLQCSFQMDNKCVAGSSTGYFHLTAAPTVPCSVESPGKRDGVGRTQYGIVSIWYLRNLG